MSNIGQYLECKYKLSKFSGSPPLYKIYSPIELEQKIKIFLQLVMAS